MLDSTSVENPLSINGSFAAEAKGIRGSWFRSDWGRESPGYACCQTAVSHCWGVPTKNGKASVLLPQVSFFRMWRGSCHRAGLQRELTWAAADSGLLLMSKQAGFQLEKAEKGYLKPSSRAYAVVEGELIRMSVRAGVKSHGRGVQVWA